MEIFHTSVFFRCPSVLPFFTFGLLAVTWSAEENMTRTNASDTSDVQQSTRCSVYQRISCDLCRIFARIGSLFHFRWRSALNGGDPASDPVASRITGEHLHAGIKLIICATHAAAYTSRPYRRDSGVMAKCCRLPASRNCSSKLVPQRFAPFVGIIQSARSLTDKAKLKQFTRCFPVCISP